MKNKIVVSIAFTVIFLIFLEVVLLFMKGPIPKDEQNNDFTYNYVDIYKNYFELKEKNSKKVYYPSRQRTLAKKFLFEKNQDTIRIFIVGGSAIRDFCNEFDFEKFIQGSFPDKKIELINCAMAGYDSYRAYLIVKEIVNYGPDLIIIASGNNEFFNPVKINIFLYKLNNGLRNFWIYRKTQDFLFSKAEKVFLREITSQERLSQYQKNIKKIVKTVFKKKATLIICTLPINLEKPPGLAAPDDKRYLRAKLLIEGKKYGKALGLLNQFLKENNNNPMAIYNIGHVNELMGNFKEAKRNYYKAVEQVYSDVRASGKSNDILRKIANEYNSILVDLEKIFQNNSENGISGYNQLYDGCHWWYDSYPMVAQSIGKVVFNKFKNGKEYCFNENADYSLIKENKHSFEVDRAVYVAVWEALTADSIGEYIISYFKQIYKISPQALWKIQFNKKEIKKIFYGNIWVKDAFLQGEYDFDKRWYWVLLHIGETYRQLKEYDKALYYFNKAISYDEDNPIGYVQRALVFYRIDKLKQAKDDLLFAMNKYDSGLAKRYLDILNL